MPGENRFLIIGIDEYPNTRYKKIANAKVDGDRLAKVLQERYGFVPAREPLYDAEATHDNVRHAILDLAQSSFEDDSLIIYYAGHGDQNSQSKKGYWIPVDGEYDQIKYIKNSTVLDDIESIQAKHILLISDSCYSGTFISRTRSSGKILTHDELEALSSRWVFVSGGETKVKDGTPGEGSPFGIALCNFLEKNTAPSVSAGELFNEVIRVVENKNGQQPAADEIRCEANEGGQMIFRLRALATERGDFPPPEALRFPLPDAKVEYYIPRLLTYYDYQESKQFRFYQPEVGKIYLNSLIQSQKRVVVLGAAGSGKSVELLYLAHLMQQTGVTLNPIYKRFNTYTEENIEDYLPENWQNADVANLVLFLDGLDEIQPKYFQTAIRKITGFAEENPLVRMVISCRNNFYELPYQNFAGTLEGFSVYTLNDISFPEIEKYVSEQFGIDGGDFIDRIRYYSFLDLVQKPFFLNILVRYYKDHGNFDSGRAGIMEEALLKYYDQDKQHFVSTVTSLGKAQLFAYLEKIAFVLEIMGKNFLTEDELFRLFPSQTDFERCKYLPAFQRQGDENKWMFEHNNLQEYIASRLLVTKKPEEIIELISVSTSDEWRVKPSWVNTLSFFTSIGDQRIVTAVLNWIISHDREVIIKFEPERMTDNQRIALFKDIFNFYSDKQIWLRSNNFSDKDLARFSESSEVLDFLLYFLESPEAGRIAKLNSLHVLSNYQLDKFPGYVPRLKDDLVSLLGLDLLSANDIYVVLGAISELKIADGIVLSEIIDRFKERRNQYIRAGLYKLLIHANAVDEYIDIFLDGVDLAELDSPATDRERINLFDESLYLKIGLEKIASATAIEAFLLRVTETENKRELLLMSDYQEIMESILKKAAKEFPGRPGLFDIILKFYLGESRGFSSNIINLLIGFFEVTDTKWKAFIKLWDQGNTEKYVQSLALNQLIDLEVIAEFIRHQAGNGDSAAKIKEFYELLLWYKRARTGEEILLTAFEKGVLDKFGIVLERPILKDWQKIHNEAAQLSFDLWFDDIKMLAEVQKVFEALGEERLDLDDVFKYNHLSNPDYEERMPVSTYLIFNGLTLHGRTISLEEIATYIFEDPDYQNIRIGHIHADIFNKPLLTISSEQKEFVRQWCLNIGNNLKILWDFVNKFEIQLPEEKVLDLTNYTNFNYDVKMAEPGSIEQLERFISKAKLKARVLENLKKPDLDMMAWTSNAGYALRHNLASGYEDILKKMERRFDYEYKFNEILTLWFTKTQNSARLKSFVSDVNTSNTRWRGISLLEESGRHLAFLNELFHRIIDNRGETLDDRIYAANHLMGQDDLYGFYYVTNMILERPDPRFEFRTRLGSIGLLKNPEAITQLISLLEIAKQPEFKQDTFNDLEERVLAALYNIGIQSDQNYIAVKTALNNFIEEFTGRLPNVNFLFYTIVRIEEQLKVKYMATYTVETALLEYNSLFNG